MAKKEINPFNITKADDFSDQQINDYWLDLTDGDGFAQLVKPTSPMPMFVLGGKGSGKTHLLRYLSAKLQRIRNKSSVLEGIARDGYIGIYLYCGDLNPGRFKDKGQNEAVWSTVFEYFVELWVAQLLLTTFSDLFSDADELVRVEEQIVKEVSELFDQPLAVASPTLNCLAQAIADLQRDVDIAVNNCAIKKVLPVEISVTRGHLIFEIPEILVRLIPSLSQCQILYLLDEFENFSDRQQIYVNSLIRGRRSPSSFKVGARLYGVKTLGTYSADEENKEGSEFEVLRLDEKLRKNRRGYQKFARRLVDKRLREVSVEIATNPNPQLTPGALDRWFERTPTSQYEYLETSFILEKYADRERPYFTHFRTSLEQGIRSGFVAGLSESQIEPLLDLLRVTKFPLLEKLNIFMVYRAWSRGKNLSDVARRISLTCARFMSDEDEQSFDHLTKRYALAMHHFKADLLAQLMRECDQKQRYVGLRTYIDMSWGLPRNLLITLKLIYGWSVFYSERPFLENPVSVRAQQSGVTEATDWFFNDARMVGQDGATVQAAIRRLGTLFRAIRFSDKPSECSCTAFSCDLSRCTPEARRIIEVAQNWSLLIATGRQSDRNSQRVDRKFQLNRMLAPLWDLAIYRRGALALNPSEIDAIFANPSSDDFDSILNTRIARMTAPSFGRANGASQKSKPNRTKPLPGFDDE